MDTDLQATDPSLQFMTSGVLDTTFYATYKKWLLYRTQDLNLYVAMVVMAIAVALISIFSRSWYQFRIFWNCTSSCRIFLHKKELIVFCEFVYAT